MKKALLLLSLFSLLIFTGCSFEPEEPAKDTLEVATQRGKFIVGVSNDSKPFGFLNSQNKSDGFDVDIAKRIAKSVFGNENAIEFVVVDVYNSISTVAAGKVDFLIAAMTVTPQRQLTVDFSDSYYTTGQAILVPKNSKITKLKDLNKKKIIVQLNSTAEKTPKKFAPAAVLLGFKSNDIAFDEFKKGRGDAIISDEALLKGFIAEHPDYKILPFRLTVEPYGIVIKNTNESTALKNEINRILQEMKSDGSLEKLKAKWNV